VAVPIPVVPDDIVPILDGTAWGKLVVAAAAATAIDPAVPSAAILGADSGGVLLWTLLVQTV